MATARMYFLFGNLDIKVKYFFEKREFLLENIEKINIEILENNLINSELNQFLDSENGDELIVYIVEILNIMNDILIITGQNNSKKDIGFRFSKIISEIKELNSDVLENIKRIINVCCFFEKLSVCKIEFFASLLG